MSHALNLSTALQLIEGALAHARDNGLAPLAVTVLDAGGHVIALQRQDGTSIRRADIATAKAYGAVALGVGSRALMARAAPQPDVLAAAGPAIGGSLVPDPGGGLVPYEHDVVLGAVGISGDSSDNDEAAAVSAIEAAGLRARTG